MNEAKNVLTNTETYEEEIIDALKDLPNDVAKVAMAEINQRTTDWLARGGRITDTYVFLQVRYARNVAKQYAQK